MSKKIALSLGFAALVSMTAASGASAADRSAIVDAIHAKQDTARIEMMQHVARSRAHDLPIRTVVLEARIQAKQALAREEVARLIEKSRQQNVGLVALASQERAQLANQLAEKETLGASDIDG